MTRIAQQLGGAALEDFRGKHGSSADQRLEAIDRMLANLSTEDLQAFELEHGTRAFLAGANTLLEHLGGPLFDTEPLDAEVAADALRGQAAQAAMRADGEFMSKWNAGDAATRDQFERAGELAFPEPEPSAPAENKFQEAVRANLAAVPEGGDEGGD